MHSVSRASRAGLQREEDMDGQTHILCVDDESRVLEGLMLNLRRNFRVSTAASGLAGLEIVKGNDPPAVVVSDMRMPEMDGATFLAQVKEHAPDTVRLLLTGQTDLNSAIAAVNQGQIFRFLTKPCEPKNLLSALEAAVKQYRLVTAEKELLEKTLRGCVAALTEVLSLASPLIFGRATRLKQHTAALLAQLGVPFSWDLEVAVMLSQIGCIVLSGENNEKLYYGKPLTPVEVESTQCVSQISLQLVKGIPRLDSVCAVLDAHDYNFDGSRSPRGNPQGEAIPLGARVLRLVSDYDYLEASGTSPTEIMSTLQARKGYYDPRLLDALACAKTGGVLGMHPIDLASLKVGMQLGQDVMSTENALLVPRGQVTLAILSRLRGMASGSIREPLMILGS
jgi:response regulator RpfG family c-di-GMP phosphodiesterase